MNPFRESIVRNPWDAPGQDSDVATIHQDVFEKCLRGIEHVRESRQSGAIMLHGEAGSGKTHLLRRLRSRLALKQPTATDRPEALFVWVRLQTSPQMIWRTVRRALVEDWFRPLSDSRCQFDRILFRRLAEIRPAIGDLEPWFEYMLQDHPDEVEQMMGEIADLLHLDHNTAVAFTHLAFRRHWRELRAWLCGDSLPEAALNRLELTQEEGTDEEHEARSRKVLEMLCKLAGHDLPIVLSFDQVEALEAFPGDHEALFAFGKFVSTLHDGTNNVLLISSVQSAFADSLLTNVREADRHRLTSGGKFSIQPLSRADARELIASRLRDSSDSPPDIADRPFWPLLETDLVELFVNGEVAARKLLTRCADRFDEHGRQPSAVGDEVVQQMPAPSVSDFLDTSSDFLDTRWQTTVEDKLASSQPHHTEEVLRHALPIASRLLAPDQKLVTDDLLPDVSLVFEGPTGRAGVSICAQANMTSLAARLKRLNKQRELQRLDRLVVLRDSRVPISPTAKASRENLARLEAGGAICLHPAVEVLAALDALRALVSDARSGDLDCHGENVEPRTLEEWLVAHLPETLTDFTAQLFGLASGPGDAPPDSARFEALSALLATQPVVSLQDAAKSLDTPAEELATFAQHNAEHFGTLGQPPAVLFRVVRHA